jgi:lipid II:glycine glycyltransferase (peptidoglycan interpeptide bridge formation enzyme)
MKFHLFSKIQFEVSHPIALIESYCYHNDFYANFDLIKKRNIEHVNKIGVRIGSDLIESCKPIIKNSINLRIFRYNLDSFLRLTKTTQKKHIRELNDKVFLELLKIPKMDFSKATKILHTLFPKIIPMIDNPLQEFYRMEINPQWKGEDSYPILSDYYDNFLIAKNIKNLDKIENIIISLKIMGLTKIRIFDILWWSLLKSDRLKRQFDINWSSVKIIKRHA